jgi:tetratricopeptide (TPR) repeat protein
MNISVTSKARNYIFISVLVVIVISLIATFSIAAEQDKAYRDNFMRYQQANQLIKEQKYIQAQKMLTELDENSRKSYQVLYSQATCAANTGDFSSAADFMQKIRETRPALLMNQNYLEQYGVILFQLGEYNRAKLYLLESKKYNTNPEATKEAEKYLAQIDEKEKGGR